MSTTHQSVGAQPAQPAASNGRRRPVRIEVTASWALFAGIALLMLGNGLQGTAIGVRASLEGFATTATGVIMSAYYAGFLAGSVLAPALLARVGHIRVFSALASLASAAVLTHVIFVNVPMWILVRVISGFSLAGLFVVAESWLHDRSTNETRGRLLALYMMVLMGALASGQLLLNVADPAGFELFVLASVLISLAVVPISLTARAAPTVEAVVPVGVRTLFRIAPLGVVGGLLVGWSHGTILGLGAVYGAIAGFSRADISAFMAITVFAGVAMQLPLGRLSDRVDRRLIIGLAAAGAAGLSFVAATGLTPSVGLLIAIMAGVGAGALPLYSLVVSHAHDYLEPEHAIGASATLIFVYGVGAVLGPFLTSLPMAVLGASGFFWTLACVHGAIAAYSLWRIARRSAPAEEQRAHYEPLPARSTAMAAYLTEGIPGIDHTGEVPVVRVDDAPVLDEDTTADALTDRPPS